MLFEGSRSIATFQGFILLAEQSTTVAAEGISPATHNAPVATVLGAGVGAILGGLVLGPAGILLGLIGGGMMGAVADQEPRTE